MKQLLSHALVLFSGVLIALLPGVALSATPDCSWSQWQQFRTQFISDDGRVIDPNDKRLITTSEGQSYGLFFALVANDKASFRTILDWTEDNLAQGDLTAHLPAWLWGRHEDGSWRVLDSNSASDSDAWIAYSLLEAGRLWENRRYQTLGTLLLQRIRKEEVIEIPGLGQMLLPGKVGFVHEDYWRLNPSYQPPQILARFAGLDPVWKEVIKSNLRLLTEGAPQGFAPDWVDYKAGSGWQPDALKGGVGSYDAIRVYLWLGMMDDGDADKAVLIKHYQPMHEKTLEQGIPPEKTDAFTGEVSGTGPVGFSAALLPFLSASPEVLAQQRQRVEQNLPGPDAYFSSVLVLFGQGWDQQRYRFNPQGELIPAWSQQCTTNKE